jgi:hypothetical protein
MYRAALYVVRVNGTCYINLEKINNLTIDLQASPRHSTINRKSLGKVYFINCGSRIENLTTYNAWSYIYVQLSGIP